MWYLGSNTTFDRKRVGKQSHDELPPLKTLGFKEVVMEKPQRDFHHPYKPYDIQLDFMNAVYSVIEDGCVGIFESPTGMFLRWKPTSFSMADVTSRNREHAKQILG